MCHFYLVLLAPQDIKEGAGLKSSPLIVVLGANALLLGCLGRKRQAEGTEHQASAAGEIRFCHGSGGSQGTQVPLLVLSL